MKLLAFIFLLMGSVGTTPGARSNVFMEVGGLSISKEGYNLIIKHEVGGGASYYDRYLKRPTWPGGASGVTVGIGYDLGYNSRDQIARDWSMLSSDVLSRLQSCAGIKGRSAKAKAATVRGLVIPWDCARQVYEKNTLPRFGGLTLRAYPGTNEMHPHIQGAMLSWTFNRGSGISSTSSRDKEKRAMRSDIPNQPYKLPEHFRSSKRLWVGKGLPGLLKRRDDEAALIESAL